MIVRYTKYAFFEDIENNKLYVRYYEDTKDGKRLYYYIKDGKEIRVYNKGSKKYDSNIRYISKENAMKKYPQYFI